MKKLIIFFMIAGCSLNGPLGLKMNKVEDLKTDQSKAFYTFGFMQGEGTVNFKLTEEEINAYIIGFVDAAKNKTYPLDRYKYQVEFQKLLQDRMEALTKDAQAESDAYMAEFLKEEGAKVTDSGLGYKIIKPGNDKKPKETDTIEINYTGTLMDGSVFDSSVERGQPAIMKLSNLILGWQEGLKLIGEGGKIKLVVPSKLAYGDRGAPQAGIAPGVAIVFEVDLIRVVVEPSATTVTPNAAKK